MLRCRNSYTKWKIFLIVINRSIRQNSDEFENVCANSLLKHINDEFPVAQLSQTLLMLVGQGSGKVILLTLEVKKLTLKLHF